MATGLEKVSFHSNPKEGNDKEHSNYRTIALISHASKVTLKILQARLQQYVNDELPDVQAGFRRQSEWLFLLDRVFFIRSVVSKEPGLENFENYLARV